MNLADYLREQPPGSGYRMAEAIWENAEAMRINLSPAAPPGPADSPASVLSLRCAGVREVNLSLLPCAEAVRLSVAAEDPLLWDHGSTASIFGNAPLPDPPKFFFDFCDLICGKFGLPRDPMKYLNSKGSLQQWLEFVYSHSYCLLQAPQAISEAAQDLLDAQAADYILLPDPVVQGESDETGGLIVIRFGGSWLICETATVQEG